MALFVVIRSQKVGERAPRHETKLRRPRGRPSPMGHEELVSNASERGGLPVVCCSSREGSACLRADHKRTTAAAQGRVPVAARRSTARWRTPMTTI